MNSQNGNEDWEGKENFHRKIVVGNQTLDPKASLRSATGLFELQPGYLETRDTES